MSHIQYVYLPYLLASAANLGNWLLRSNIEEQIGRFGLYALLEIHLDVASSRHLSITGNSGHLFVLRHIARALYTLCIMVLGSNFWSYLQTIAQILPALRLLSSLALAAQTALSFPLIYSGHWVTDGIRKNIFTEMIVCHCHCVIVCHCHCVSLSLCVRKSVRKSGVCRNFHEALNLLLETPFFDLQNTAWPPPLYRGCRLEFLRLFHTAPQHFYR